MNLKYCYHASHMCPASTSRSFYKDLPAVQAGDGLCRRHRELYDIRLRNGGGSVWHAGVDEYSAGCLGGVITLMGQKLKREFISLTLSLILVIMASKAYACLIQVPEDRYEVVKTYLDSLKETDTLFIGVVVNIDSKPVKLSVPNGNESTRTYQVIKALQKSSEGDLVRGKTVISSPCGGDWQPDAGHVVLYANSQTGEKAFSLAWHPPKMEWYFSRNAQIIEEKFGYDVKSEIGAISDIADQARNSAEIKRFARRNKNWFIYGAPFVLLAGLLLFRRHQKRTKGVRKQSKRSQ